MKRTFLVALVWLFSSALWAADHERLDIKPGQWEMTFLNQIGGALPFPDDVLARLTPDQRAKLLAAMQSGNGKTTITKNCFTKDQLDKAFDPGNEQIKSCTHTILSSSHRMQEIRIVCDRGEKMTGTVKVEAIDSGNIRGTVVMAVTDPNGQTTSVNSSFTSKWLGPACTGK